MILINKKLEFIKKSSEEKPKNLSFNEIKERAKVKLNG